MSAEPILNLPAGLHFRASGRTASIDSLSVSAGEWLVITPEAGGAADDAAPPLARLLATLGAPLKGSVELFGQPLNSLAYVDLQRVRTRLGFVVCRGGLLSNRTVAENIALPLSVHANLAPDAEVDQVSKLMGDFGLAGTERRRPDELDGATRFRVCVARALALSPQWIVVEGTGDFGQPQSPTWGHLEGFRAATPSAMAVCLRAPDARFEEWITARGGRVIRYRFLSEAA